MKMITVHLPDIYVKILEEMIAEHGLSRGRLLIIAIRDKLKEDMALMERFDPEFKTKLVEREEIRLKRLKLLNLYRKCITCGSRVNSKGPYAHDQDFEVMELRFCCSCFKKYEKLAFDDFPEEVKDKISERLEESNDILLNLKKIEKTIREKSENKRDFFPPFSFYQGNV